MQLDENKVTEIFFILDEFSKNFNNTVKKYSVGDGKRHRDKPNRLSDAEVMLILIMFHDGATGASNTITRITSVCTANTCSRAKCLTAGFVELERKVMLQLCCFVKTCLMAECSGVSYVDSTPLRVCRNQRILQHKVFKGFAERGKCSMGWFYGFKLHLIINDRGEILNFMITPANVDDREPLKQHRFLSRR